MFYYLVNNLSTTSMLAIDGDNLDCQNHNMGGIPDNLCDDDSFGAIMKAYLDGQVVENDIFTSVTTITSPAQSRN